MTIDRSLEDIIKTSIMSHDQKEKIVYYVIHEFKGGCRFEGANELHEFM